MADENEIESDSSDNVKTGAFMKIRQEFDSPLRAVLGAKKKGKAVCFRSSILDGWPENVHYTHTLDMSALSASEKRSLRLESIPGVSIRRYA